MDNASKGPADFYAVRLSQQKVGDKNLWTAAHPNLLGCQVISDDPQKALDDLRVVREAWIEQAQAHGVRLPLPAWDLRHTIVFDADHTPSHAETGRAAITHV